MLFRSSSFGILPVFRDTAISIPFASSATMLFPLMIQLALFPILKMMSTSLPRIMDNVSSYKTVVSFISIEIVLWLSAALSCESGLLLLPEEAPGWPAGRLSPVVLLGAWPLPGLLFAPDEALPVAVPFVPEGAVPAKLPLFEEEAVPGETPPFAEELLPAEPPLFPEE